MTAMTHIMTEAETCRELMPLPLTRTQLKLRGLYRCAQALKSRHATFRQANEALIPATLECVFSGSH